MVCYIKHDDNVYINQSELKYFLELIMFCTLSTEIIFFHRKLILTFVSQKINIELGVTYLFII